MTYFLSDFKTITHQQLVRYAGASGDFNPIHTVVPRAHEAGFPDVIAHGMYVMGLASCHLLEWFSDREIVSYEVRFTAPTYPGEKVQVEAELDVTEMKASVLVRNEGGELKLKGTVSFR